MYVIITCKYEKDPIKNSPEKVETSFSSLVEDAGKYTRYDRPRKSTFLRIDGRTDRRTDINASIIDISRVTELMEDK